MNEYVVTVFNSEKIRTEQHTIRAENENILQNTLSMLAKKGYELLEYDVKNMEE